MIYQRLRCINRTKSIRKLRSLQDISGTSTTGRPYGSREPRALFTSPWSSSAKSSAYATCTGACSRSSMATVSSDCRLSRTTCICQRDPPETFDFSNCGLEMCMYGVRLPYVPKAIYSHQVSRASIHCLRRREPEPSNVLVVYVLNMTVAIVLIESGMQFSKTLRSGTQRDLEKD